MPQFYYDILRAYSTRVFNSLEWGLSSPPKAHAYVSLPLQSGQILPMSKIKRLIYSSIIIFITGFLARYLI